MSRYLHNSSFVFHLQCDMLPFSFCSLGKICLQDDSPRLWAFLFATYWVSLVTYFLLWKAYVHVSVLRANALMAPGLKPEQFAVLVRDIPPAPEGQTRKEQVDSYFKSIYPETYYRSMVVTDNKEVFTFLVLAINLMFWIPHPKLFL